MNVVDHNSHVTEWRLNPLGIGEGFEQQKVYVKLLKKSLNPLGIGEGFEPASSDLPDDF